MEIYHENVITLDISKLARKAQTAIIKIYNLLLNKNNIKERKQFEFIIKNPLIVEKIILLSRNELNEHYSIS